MFILTQKKNWGFVEEVYLVLVIFAATIMAITMETAARNTVYCTKTNCGHSCRTLYETLLYKSIMTSVMTARNVN